MKSLYRPFRGTYPITQAYGPTDFADEPPLGVWLHFHRGVDYAVPTGTPLLASGPGVVVFAGEDTTGYGLSVVVDLGDGMTSRVAHLSKIDVRLRASVTSDTRLGLSGSTGNSSGPHVHWEVDCFGFPLHPWYVVVDRS